ncbi:protein kinase [Streptomyces sp. NPDC096132]|uniref:protein kinase domain-containing protein n=1 Tax=Streptomyces sp. NPDC096132 TaxID=3366075 RepID=UPI00381FAEE7
MEPLREDDPERIGGHELFALLGQGGWGNVYYARTGRGRSIALKTIRPDCLEENPERFRKRFAREVEAAKAVDPRHTAEVVDSDTQAPEPWFATRYIAGVNLSEALDHCRSPLSQRTWRVLAVGLTDALRSIHRAGLVHRDLKLANVLLGAEGASVIDFGIARHLSPTDGTTLTGTGTNPRTMSFASPEQLRDERVGPATDVFALGLVLAYTALNRHPFGTGSPMEIAANILTGRPSLEGLPLAVEKVVRPCLEPSPGNRPGPAEIAGLLAADAATKERDWLPPGLRATIDRRSRHALDLDGPLRPGRRTGRGSASPAGAAASGRASGLTYEPTPAKERSAQNARLSRERELSSAPSGRTETEATAPPQAAPDNPDAQLRASAEAGNAKAMRRLAARLKSAGDIDSALLWYRRAAQVGNPTGAREAGQLIERHFPDQLRQAVALYRMAANAGDAVATTRLAELLGTERDRPAGAPERDEKAGTAAAPVSPAEQAMLRKHRAAAMDGQINSLLALGDWYRQRNREQDALVWYWRAAENGHPHCMFMTAALLAKDPQRDSESLKWFRAAADAGNTEAMHRLGQRMEKNQRPADALDFYRSADRPAPEEEDPAQGGPERRHHEDHRRQDHGGQDHGHQDHGHQVRSHQEARHRREGRPAERDRTAQGGREAREGRPSPEGPGHLHQGGATGRRGVREGGRPAVPAAERSRRHRGWAQAPQEASREAVPEARRGGRSAGDPGPGRTGGDHRQPAAAREAAADTVAGAAAGGRRGKLQGHACRGTHVSEAGVRGACAGGPVLAAAGRRDEQHRGHAGRRPGVRGARPAPGGPGVVRVGSGER